MTTVLFFKATNQQPSLHKGNGLYRAAKAYGWQLQTIDPLGGDRRSIRKVIAFWKPDGIVMDCGNLPKPPPLSVFGGVPTVFIGTLPDIRQPMFTACEDPRATAFMAARELLRLDCAHYAFVKPAQRRFWSEARARSFQEAVRINGKNVSELVLADTEKADVLRWMPRLQKELKGLPKPCGIFAADDTIAAKVLSACSRAHLRIPEDIALLGVGNDESICANARPTLSSIAQDFERAGYLAARLLAARLHSPRMKPASRTFPPLMVVRRASTRARTHFNEEIGKAIDLIRARACEGLRAADVIKAMKGSRRLCEMRFREATGHSILDEIQSVRIERARELLLDGRRTVRAVANMCGYASVAAFRKVCRGILPTEKRTDSVPFGDF